MPDDTTGGAEPAADAARAAKQSVRERVWTTLEERGVARFPGARGRIPNFQGADDAAVGLCSLPEVSAATAAKCNPDSPQLPVRARLLGAGTAVFMAVPRLADARPFLLLDPADVDRPARRAVSIRGAGEVGRPTRLEELPALDLVVCGSVAVNHAGARVGKGGGYSDLELALCIEAGVVDEDTVVVTTVHPLQVLDEELPERPHDFRVDLVVTPDGVVDTRGSGGRRRPRGVLWGALDEDRIAAIPVLATRERARRRH